MTSRPHLLILGGGLAGHSAALAARHNGYDGRITIATEESYAPYDRTPLSKAVLQNKRDVDDLPFQPDSDYAEHDIVLMTNARAVSVDFGDRVTRFDDGQELAWDQLLIATGAKPIRLSNPGFNLPGVHYLRDIPDALKLRSDLNEAQRVLVVGAGFIGSEVAASARMLGKDVTLVDMLSAPMIGALHPEIAELCAVIHRERGVNLLMESTVVELRGSTSVESALLGNGQTIECDIVVVGVGVRPCVELFEGSDLEIEDGIKVNEFCESSIPGVYAAGDVARWWHPALQQWIRIEHFDNAGAQGTAAGKAIAGNRDEPYAPVPYFWSDQYDTNIQYAGYPIANCEVVLRSGDNPQSITGFYLNEGAVCAAVTVNRAREFRPARRLVAAQAEIDPDTLQDPETDLRKLSRQFR